MSLDSSALPDGPRQGDSGPGGLLRALRGRRQLLAGWLAVLATVLLLGGGGSLWLLLRLTFPPALPLPAAAKAPAAGQGAQPTGADRLVVRYGLLDHLAEARNVELPLLDEAHAAAQRGYGRGVPLWLPGLRGPLRKVAVAMPLGLEPGSAAEVDHELRHALYLPPPARLSWVTTLPGPAPVRLELDLAALPVPGQTAPARLEVRVSSLEDGRRIAATLEVPRPRSTSVGTTASATASEPLWQPVRIDLDPLAGQQVEITLVASLEPAGGAMPVGSVTGAGGPGSGEAEPGAAAVAGGQPGPSAHVLAGDPVVVGRPRPSEARRPNLLWINIDTVQAAATGVGGDAHGATPQLDRLAAEGVTFERAYATSNWTRPSNMSFLTGLYPSETGLKVEMIPTLAEERRAYYLSGIVALPLHLGRHGYRTRAVVQNNLLEDVWGTGVDVGFDEYGYVQETLQHTAEITEQAIRFIEARRDERWFLYLGYNAPHWPYRCDREALRRAGIAGDRPQDWLHSVYRGAVSMSDAAIGPLYETLQQLGLEQDTLIVVNSDHGEQLRRDHAQELVRASLWQAGTTSKLLSRPGHETLFEEVVRVPLVLRWPGTLPAGRRIDEPVAMYDLPPTLLELMGVPPLPGRVRGRSLAWAVRGRDLPAVPVLIEGKSVRGVVDGRYKYIRRGPEPGTEWIREPGGPWRRVAEELYDLVQDPLELHDLASSAPEELQRLRALLVRLAPRKRYLYLLEARAGEAPPGGATGQAAAGTWLRVRLGPAPGLGAFHLLEEEPEDVPGQGEQIGQAMLHLPPGDVDQLAFTTASADARLVLELAQEPGDGSPDPALDMPIRVGRWELPLGTTPLELRDDDPYVALDSDRDPQRRGPGIYLWRMPITGGIATRGAELNAAVQETFRGWGYVR